MPYEDVYTYTENFLLNASEDLKKTHILAFFNKIIRPCDREPTKVIETIEDQEFLKYLVLYYDNETAS